MVQKTAITDIFKSLAEVESRFHLRRTEDEQFFPEWYDNLPQITDEEKASLDVIRRRYLYHLADGNLTNGIVFVKLTQHDTPQYDVSRIFSPAPLGNKLYTVLQILKRIGQIIVSS